MFIFTGEARWLRLRSLRSFTLAVSAVNGVLLLAACFYFSKAGTADPSPHMGLLRAQKGGGLCVGGPLSLETDACSLVREELVLLARNSKPGKAPSLLLALRSGQQTVEVASGQTLFVEALENRMQFTSTPTSFKIRPVILDHSRVQIEVEKEDEKKQFVLEPCVVEHNPIRETEYFKTLESAKLWGEDLFLKQYGGEEYKGMQEGHKIEFCSEGSSYVCVVNTGDHLSYQEGRWQNGLLQDAPLLQVKEGSSKEADIVLWDESGFYCEDIHLSEQKEQKLSVKPEGLPSSFRLRTATHVSCVLGKRRALLKEGDWLLKTPSGWHNVKKVDDIEALVQYRLRGELLVFDKLEKEQGKSVLKGHFFSEMRTQMQPVTIPIVSEKKKHKKSIK